MINLKNISSVAKYERKTLFRSWFFRIFSLLTLLILFSMNMGVFAEGGARWTGRAIAANMPYINTLFVNVAQAVIAVFLASDFLRRDKKLDTTEVIYARPISNGEYVVGKTLGIMSLFMALTMVVLLMSLLFNLIIKDTPVIWEAYLLYPLLISIPTLLFILGLSFFLMILLKSQAVTFVVLLGYIGLALFYFKDKLYGLLDYMTFNFPLVYSDFIGFGDLEGVLLHRLAYFLMGLGFIFATIKYLNRLPQTGGWDFINLAGFIVFLGAGLFLAYQYYDSKHSIDLDGENFIAVNNKYVEYPVADVVSNDLDVRQKGSNIEVSSSMMLWNQNFNPLDTILISLNPGYKIDSLTSRGVCMEYEKEGALLKIVPESALRPWQRMPLKIVYRGKASNSVANLDITKEVKASLKRIQVGVLDKLPGIKDEDFILLTRELLWYPVAGVGYNTKTFQPVSPDFTHFSLRVKTREGLTAVCPGEMMEEEGEQIFTMEHDLNMLPLVIGPFEKMSRVIDGVEYAIYMKPGHDYFSEFFTNIQDTLDAIIKEEKENYEYDEIDLYYSEKRISLVEVPVQYHAYESPYTQHVDYIQPQMIFIPEKGVGLNTLDFKRFKRAEERRNKERERTRTPKEIEVDLFVNFIRNTFFRTEAEYGGGFGRSGERLITFNTSIDYLSNPYCVFPLYYNLFTDISSTEFPQFNTMIELYLKEGYEVSPRQSFRGGITESEKANLALQDSSLAGVFSFGDQELSSSTISQAGSFILSALKNRVGDSEFDNFLYYYLEDRPYSEINFDHFAADFMNEFGVNIRQYLEFLKSSTDLPEFLVSDPEYYTTRDDYGDVYIVRMEVSNVGGNTGLIDFSFIIPGSGGFGGGGMEQEHRLFELEAGMTKEIQLVFYEQPRVLTVNTLISGNVPATFSVFLRSAEERNIKPLEDYERVIAARKNIAEEGEIIVDNEDPGFSFVSIPTDSKLKQYIDSKKPPSNELDYGVLETWYVPPGWTPVAHSGMYGQTVRSAMAARSGDGQNYVKWTTDLEDAGFYEIFVYIPVSAMYEMPSRNREGGRGGDRGGRRGRGPRFADRGTEYTYTVVSSEGTEDVQFILSDPEDGWNRLGTFHFPADTVSVMLSNKTNGRRVIADAVKWEKRN